VEEKIRIEECLYFANIVWRDRHGILRLYHIPVPLLALLRNQLVITIISAVGGGIASIDLWRLDSRSISLPPRNLVFQETRARLQPSIQRTPTRIDSQPYVPALMLTKEKSRHTQSMLRYPVPDSSYSLSFVYSIGLILPQFVGRYYTEDFL